MSREKIFLIGIVDFKPYRGGQPVFSKYRLSDNCLTPDGSLADPPLDTCSVDE
jgi:hypothetical protein